MATAKLNKEKLKRMMEQKDTIPVNLDKKRRGDLALKPVLDEVVVRPVAVLEPAPVVHVLALSVEVVEPTEVPLSSWVIEKAPNLALDASFA
jgi:phage gp46-like protein